MRIRGFVAGLEETIIRTLDHFGVKGFRQAKKVGVWTGPREKIASIGVRIRRGVTSHGLSLNVNMSGDPADLIIVCGMPDVRMVSLSQFLDRPPDVKDVKQVLADSFGTVFGVDLQRSSLQEANLM
jgi:lipoate-protein ligase B